MKDTLNPKYEGFLMISIQNVCGKAILIRLIPTLVEAKMTTLYALRPPLRVLVPLKDVKEVLIHIRFSIAHRYQRQIA